MFGKPKISNFYLEVLCNQNICELQIAVYNLIDSEYFECFFDLDGYFAHLLLWHATPTVLLHIGGKIRMLAIFEHQVQVPGSLFELH